MLAQDFIYAALRKIGQIRPGYTASPELMADALAEWATFFDALNAERTANYSNPDYVYPILGPGSQSDGNGYLIGPSATTAPATTTSAAGTANDWNGPRPDSIIRANLKMTSLSAQPVYIPLRPITQEEWAGLAIRQIPAINVTSVFWYDPQFPNGVFNVFPPLNGNAIELFTWGVLAPPLSLGAAWSAPPGYQDMVILNLAARLYYMATREVVIRAIPYQILASQAQAALDKIRAVNRPIQRLRNDFSGGRRPGGAGYYDSFVTATGEPY